jgi:hypothetical protein
VWQKKKPEKDFTKKLQIRRLEKLRNRWEDNAKLDLKGIERECGDSVRLTQNRKML